jgi:hypothetical protein
MARCSVGTGKSRIEDPNAADVNSGERRGADDGENGHRFCSAVDARSPVLAEEEQNRRDERAGVTDTDPENEVHDVVNAQ